MKFGRSVILVTVLVISAPHAVAQDDVKNLHRRIDAYMAAFNAKDNAAMQAQAAYPHVFCGPDGQPKISSAAEDLVTDFDQLTRERDWTRSEVESLEISQRSDSKAHVAIQFSSYTDTGERYQSSAGLWMLVKHEGDWFVQLQSWMGPNESAKVDRTAAAKKFLEDFLAAFNARDEEKLQGMTLYPHVFVLHDGQAIIAQDSSEMTIDFEKLSAEDGWDHSTFDSYELIQSSPSKIHVAVKFSRYNKAGQRYHSANVLYVLAQRDGRWGLQMRSVLEQTAVTLQDDEQ